MKIYGITKIGPKGQVVIPQEARQDFNLKPGDKVMILSPTGTGILIVPVEKVKQRLQIFKDFLDNDLD